MKYFTFILNKVFKIGVCILSMDSTAQFECKILMRNHLYYIKSTVEKVDSPTQIAPNILRSFPIKLHLTEKSFTLEPLGG